MKYLTYTTFMLLTLFALTSNAQNVSDAVRWSTLNPGATARTFGVGGAFGAMGGDFSVININPAGLGEYAKGEFTISTSLNINESEAYLVGDASNRLIDDQSNLKIDNIGFVINSNPRGSDWTHINFAIGYNKIANLNTAFVFAGATPGSITEEFAEYANGRTIEELDDFRAYPALATGAIYDLDGDFNYETDFQENPLLDVNKSQIVNQEGSINELAFAWGGKYLNRLNIGIAIGVPIVSYEETKSYAESDEANDFSAFENLEYTEYLNTTGAGFNFKAGLGYEIAKSARIGLAVHSPTYYTLNDDYYTNLTYSFIENEVQTFSEASPDGSFKYQLESPWRVIGSLGTIYRIGDEIVGFVNADVEWLDYANSRLDFTEFSNNPAEARNTLAINNEIQRQLGSALNVNIGTELGYKKLRLRAGYGTSESPFLNDNERNAAYSFGIGLRERSFFLDAGFRLSTVTTGYLPYTVIDKERDPLVNIEQSNSRFLVTAGFKF